MFSNLLTILSLLISCSLRVNSIFFTPTANPGCLTSQGRDDCYSPGSTVTEASCGTSRCRWCPSNIANEPWCIDGCDPTTSTAVDCFSTPTTGVTEATCLARNVCKFCSNVPTGTPICQANYNDCLVNGRVDAKPTGTAVTRTSCESTAPTGLYCPTTTAGMPWCIVAQPAAARCFNTVQAAFGTTTTQCECHRAGGVFCTTAPNLNRCISLPGTPPSTCPTTGRQQCFPSGLATPTQAQCELIGCTWCAGTALPNCIHAIRATPACPATGK